VIEAPEPTNVPPQLPARHFHAAPVPSEPPCTVKVELSPTQSVLRLVSAPVGAVDSVFKVRVALLLYRLLQPLETWQR
jgi:hypothetical protein